MVSPDKATGLNEWKSGWTLVLASAIGYSFYSVMIGGLGLFMEPLDKAFGWSRALLSSGPGIATVITAILSPFFGTLIDRVGTRRLVLPGLVLTIITMAAFGLVTGAAWQWLALWVVYGIVSTSLKSTAWTAAVLGVFTGSRGLALGLMMSGLALSQILLPPLGNWLIAELGWRAAYVWLALGWGGVALVFCLLFFFDVHDREAERRRQNGTTREQEPSATLDLPGLTIRQAWRNAALWRIGISNLVVMALTNGLAIHLFPILTQAGVSRANAAWLTSLGGIAAIAGKLLTGVLLDRFRPNWIGALTFGTAAASFLLLMDNVRSPGLIVLALVVNGYAAGTKMQIAGFLTAGYGGMRNFGAIYGVMGGLLALAGGIGPMAAGLVYDLAGSYGPFLAAGGIGCALCGLLILTLPRYPDWQAHEAAPA
ncbi:MFS transporter [Novosphingobium album (ex Liu et al. 2023)]|uniref:MFS transporter n=1 Tax=Novosphingobium album (ex Liu et al. 2023) TaxID=3031130 RepID=A0ABT5WPM3_9SPHN|nr:MFS transporter [Novosphingobium album (ex Liu et al. 2023)]MDE8651992.1 MFS transporter [Novosphingobium album (ex Liu et al. 2023)]